MSLTVSLGAALSGLRVNQKAIEVASHNVANASTPGYSRQTVTRETISIAGQGGGVRTAAIDRAVDDFLLKEIRQQSGMLGEQAARERYLGRTQDMFGSPTGDGSLPSRLAQFAGRIDALAIEPESATRRLDMVEAAKALARELNDGGKTVQSLRREADQEIAIAVREVNGQLAAIAKLNGDIARDLVHGRPVNDLLDARDQALAKVAEIMDVQSYTREGGELVLYTNGGQPLVDRAVHPLSYAPAAGVGVATGFQEITVDGVPITAEIRTGRIKGLLDLRDQTLPGLQAQLDTLAERLRDEANLAHNRGTAVPAPNALTGRRAFENVAGERITLSDPVRIAVVDGAGTIQAYYDLPAGSHSIAEVRGAIDAGLGGAATATAADGAGLSIAAADAGHGIAIVDLAGGKDATVTYTADGATREFRGFSSFFGLNDFFVSGARVAGDDTAGLAQMLAVRDDIAADPGRVARARLYDDRATPPTNGATVGISAGDSRTLAGMAAVVDAGISFPASGGLSAVNGRLGDFAAQILSLNAMQASEAKEAREYRQAAFDDIAFKATSHSGVNIDEEMANLVAYQNAYAASARVISVVTEMLDALMRIR